MSSLSLPHWAERGHVVWQDQTVAKGLHHSIWLLNWAWEQGWCSSKSACLPPLWLGLVLHVGWVCCWCWSLLQGFFLGLSSFPPFTKTNIPNSNLTWKQWIGRATLWNVTKFPFICFFVIGFLTVIKYLRKVIYHENKLCWTSWFVKVFWPSTKMYLTE